MKQYSEADINRHVAALYLELPESIADINRDIIHQLMTQNETGIKT